MSDIMNVTYYISSGRKNAMYTLRVERRSGRICVDNYIGNLSTDADKAEEKAREYFDRIVARIPDTDTYKNHFAGYADFDLFERRGKLSVIQTEQLETLERGIMPFGKNSGKQIADLPMNTILWWADHAKQSDQETNSNVVFQAVCSYCLGVALDKDYIAKREIIRKEREEKDLRSDYIGEIKQRIVFSGKLEAVISCGIQQIGYNSFTEKFMNKIMVGDNVVVYFGKELGKPGEDITIKATVKAHQEYKGIKQTIVNRPA